MKLHGDNLAANQIVLVDGRPIQADIKELDTEEGYVDIFLPVFESVNTIDADDGVDESNVPLFDVEVKRLEGKVEVLELKPPQ